MQLLAIFIGGGLGSLARFGVGKLAGHLFDNNLPFGTFFANLLSCLVLGLVIGGIIKTNNSFWFPFLTIGFCGGFSTFSTFSFETLELMRNGQMIWAILNVVISISICLAILYFLSKSNA